MALSSKCGQCRVANCGTRLNRDSLSQVCMCVSGVSCVCGNTWWRPQSHDQRLVISGVHVCVCVMRQVCPVCVATPGGDPNHMTDDLISHLLVDHHGGQKPDANISFESLSMPASSQKVTCTLPSHTTLLLLLARVTVLGILFTPIVPLFTSTLHTFSGPFSGTTRVSRYQKGKTNLPLFTKQQNW